MKSETLHTYCGQTIIFWISLCFLFFCFQEKAFSYVCFFFFLWTFPQLEIKQLILQERRRKKAAVFLRRNIDKKIYLQRKGFLSMPFNFNKQNMKGLKPNWKMPFRILIKKVTKTLLLDNVRKQKKGMLSLSGLFSYKFGYHQIGFKSNN